MDVADGSSNPVTSNSIALDGSGNPYIIGNFDCIMNSYADRYGQGTFNSVGYWIFLMQNIVQLREPGNGAGRLEDMEIIMDMACRFSHRQSFRHRQF